MSYNSNVNVAANTLRSMINNVTNYKNTVGASSNTYYNNNNTNNNRKTASLTSLNSVANALQMLNNPERFNNQTYNLTNLDRKLYQTYLSLKKDQRVLNFVKTINIKNNSIQINNISSANSVTTNNNNNKLEKLFLQYVELYKTSYIKTVTKSGFIKWYLPFYIKQANPKISNTFRNTSNQIFRKFNILLQNNKLSNKPSSLFIRLRKYFYIKNIYIDNVGIQEQVDKNKELPLIKKCLSLFNLKPITKNTSTNDLINNIYYKSSIKLLDPTKKYSDSIYELVDLIQDLIDGTTHTNLSNFKLYKKDFSLIDFLKLLDAIEATSTTSSINNLIKSLDGQVLRSGRDIYYKIIIPAKKLQNIEKKNIQEIVQEIGIRSRNNTNNNNNKKNNKKTIIFNIIVKINELITSCQKKKIASIVPMRLNLNRNGQFDHDPISVNLLTEFITSIKNNRITYQSNGNNRSLINENSRFYELLYNSLNANNCRLINTSGITTQVCRGRLDNCLPRTVIKTIDKNYSVPIYNANLLEIQKRRTYEAYGALIHGIFSYQKVNMLMNKSIGVRRTNNTNDNNFLDAYVRESLSNDFLATLRSTHCTSVLKGTGPSNNEQIKLSDFFYTEQPKPNNNTTWKELVFNKIKPQITKN